MLCYVLHFLIILLQNILAFILDINYWLLCPSHISVQHYKILLYRHPCAIILHFFSILFKLFCFLLNIHIFLLQFSSNLVFSSSQTCNFSFFSIMYLSFRFAYSVLMITFLFLSTTGINYSKYKTTNTHHPKVCVALVIPQDLSASPLEVRSSVSASMTGCCSRTTVAVTMGAREWTRGCSSRTQHTDNFKGNAGRPSIF